MTTLALHDVHWKLHASEIFVIRVTAFQNRIAGQPAIDFGLDAFDKILVVDCTRDGVLAKRRE